MPLIVCPDCNGSVSSRAIACPHCGCPAEFLFSEKTVGDCVFLGAWGEEEIRWRIIEEDYDSVFLLSEKIIDCQPFNPSTSNGSKWKQSYLERWLKFKFGPQAGLPDTPRCLSIREVETLLQYQHRRCGPTDFAATHHMPSNNNGFCNWWLLSPASDRMPSSAAYVDQDGNIKFCSVDCRHGIRPALWVKKSAEPLKAFYR